MFIWRKSQLLTAIELRESKFTVQTVLWRRTSDMKKWFRPADRRIVRGRRRCLGRSPSVITIERINIRLRPCSGSLQQTAAKQADVGRNGSLNLAAGERLGDRQRGVLAEL